MTLYINFGPLDNRAHCTYFASDRFVILSKVDEIWRVKVGLVPDPHRAKPNGEEDKARWWQMSWSAEDAKAVLVRWSTPDIGVYLMSSPLFPRTQS